MSRWDRFRGVRLRELDTTRSATGVLPCIQFTLDAASLQRMTEAFNAFPAAVDMALLTATDKTRLFARNQLVRQYRELLTLKPAYISRGIKGRKARRTLNGVEAEIRIATGNIPLSRFALRPERPPQLKGVPVKNRRRVSYRLRTTGRNFGDTAFGPGAATPLFVARTDSGHIGAFYRTGKGSRGALVQEWAPSLQYHAHAPGFLSRITELSAHRFEEVFRAEARSITGVEA